jgi:hypothetical protein
MREMAEIEPLIERVDTLLSRFSPEGRRQARRARARRRKRPW